MGHGTVGSTSFGRPTVSHVCATDLAFQNVQHSVGPRADVELAVDRYQMGADSVDGDVQRAGDFLVKQPPGQQ